MDRREAIMARLQEIAAAVEGVVTAERNRVGASETQLPLISVLEGDERVLDDDIGRSRPSLRPYRIEAMPQVFIRVDGDDVGTDLNALKRKVTKAVLADEELSALSANGYSVRYAGMESTLHAARSMIGAMALMFAITYVLKPNELED